MLNRVVRRTKYGWELEADLRHAELIIEQLGLQDAKSVSTPGISSLVPDNDDDDTDLLSPADATVYRAITARCNYLQPDRLDIQYAVKEVCRLMATPTQRAWEILKRIGRYLKRRPRLIWQFCWQSEMTILDVHSDANWAGCKKSRKSSSGGTVAIGNHLIKAYSKTQAVVAKSSGESELYGVVRASTEALGISTLLEDFGLEGVRVRVGMDANAAIGIVQRSGLNKLRHVELDVLWVQEQQARRLLPIRKVPGPENPSDMMTKNVTQLQIDQYVNFLNLRYEDGRATIAQQLHYMEVKDSRYSDVRADSIMFLKETAHVHSVASGCKSVDGAVETSRGRSKISPANSPQVLDRLHFESARLLETPEERVEIRRVDSWSRDGKDGRWTRLHRSARRALFTPFKVAGGPNQKTPLKRLRITRGKYFASGRTFKIIDDWTVQANAHRLLEGAWVGTTDFREIAEYVDDDTDEDESAGKEEDLVKEPEAAAEDPERNPKAVIQQEGSKCQYFELSPDKAISGIAPEAAAESCEGRQARSFAALGAVSSLTLASNIRNGQSDHLSGTSRGRAPEGECKADPTDNTSCLTSFASVIYSGRRGTDSLADDRALRIKLTQK